MERSYIQEVFDKGKEEKVLVKGWVHETRALGKVRFLLIRDMTGVIQCVAVKNSPVFDLMSQSRENVISVEGKVVKSKQAPGGMEIVPEKIEVFSEAEQPLPIDVGEFSKTELPK